MKKFFLIAFMALSSASLSFGQDFTGQGKGLMQTGTVSIRKALPVIFVDSMMTKSNHLVVKPSDMEVIKIYKAAAATKVFGEKGKNGVVLAKLKSGAPLHRLDDLYKHFDVSESKKKLKVLLNKSILIDPQLFLADLSQIEKIEVATLDATNMVLYSLDANEKYLNIVTATK